MLYLLDLRKFFKVTRNLRVKMKKRYQNKELDSAYQKAVKVLNKYGNELLLASPAYNNRVPESLTAKIGVGMAVGLWAGIHSVVHGGKTPFATDIPMYAIYQAGKEWGRYRNPVAAVSRKSKQGEAA